MNQKTFVIVHGWTGSAEKDWMPWLASQLRLRGYKVIVPNMPLRNIPMPFLWVPYLNRVVGQVTPDTYFVGHSVGCQAIMRMLARQDNVAGGAVFVGGWFVPKDFLGTLKVRSALNKFFLRFIAIPRAIIAWWESPFDYAKLRKNLPRSTVMLSTRDRFVDADLNASLFRERVGSSIVMVENAGHFTKADGFAEFELLLEQVLKMTSHDKIGS